MIIIKSWLHQMPSKLKSFKDSNLNINIKLNIINLYVAGKKINI